MRRFLALLLTCVLFVNAAFAGLNRNKSRYVGGTAKDIPVPSVGALDTTDQIHLTTVTGTSGDITQTGTVSLAVT